MKKSRNYKKIIKLITRIHYKTVKNKNKIKNKNQKYF